MFNAHQLTSSRALEMLESGEMSDCVIEVQEEQNGGQEKKKSEFNVHKLVLTVNSDVFRAMFSHKNTKECQESRIVIEDSTAKAVRQMFIYMYTGALPPEYDIETEAGLLLNIANKYQIKTLVQLIEQGLANSLSLENVFYRLEMADLYQIKSLYFSCGQLIRRNLKMVKKDVKWLELKKKAPELAFSILEEFAEEFDSSNFAAPNGNDTMVVYGIQQSVPTKHMCISGMKEYQCQSLEELRRADYLAGRKVNTSAPTETSMLGQQQRGVLFGPAPTGTLFGQQQRGGLFGQGLTKPIGGIFTEATTSFPAFLDASPATTSLFGTQAASAEPFGSIFSQTSSQSQKQPTGIFGQQQSAVMAQLPSTSMAKEQQHDGPQFGLHQNPLNRTIDTGNTDNFGSDLKEQKLMIANLENQALNAKVEKAELMPQGALENPELKAENLALKENAEQKANYQALEAKLSTQTEKHQKQVEELESKNRMLEEKLKMLNLETKEKRTLDGKMEQLKDECSNSKKLPGLDVE